MKPSADAAHHAVERILHLGLALACALMIVGMAVRLQSDGAECPFSVRELFQCGDLGWQLTGAGVLVLAVTPLVRVAALVVIWARERDWRFVLVALTVAAMLGASVLLGGR